jgi:cell volume regulation protein A
VSVDQFNLTLVAVSVVLIVAIVAVKVSARVGLPTLLVYLAIGMGIGESGLGVRFDDAELVQIVGLGLLAVILAEGGLTTRWSVVRPALAPSLVLATVGVAISVAVTASLSYWILGLDLRTALLLGAIVSSTDAAAVFSVLRRVRVNRRLAATLEAESGFNDAPVVILVAVLVSDAWEQVNLLAAGGQMLLQLVAGAVVGLVVARGGELLLRRVALPSSGLYSIATMAIAILAFGAAGALGASSFIAVYLAGLRLGNARLPHEGETRTFAEGLAWLSQIGLFVLLGLLVSPSTLPGAIAPALVVGTVLLLVARPLSVLLVATPFGLPWRDQVFLSWAGLRGAVPIVLATLPVSAGIPAATQVFNVVFVLVVIFTLVQAPVLPRLARALRVDGLTVTRVPMPNATRVELVASGDLPVVGLRLGDLELPTVVAVEAVVRDGESVDPDPTTVIRRGDRLVLHVPHRGRRSFDRCLRALTGGSLSFPDDPQRGGADAA